MKHSGKIIKLFLIFFLVIVYTTISGEIFLRLSGYQKKPLHWENGTMQFFNMHPKRIYYLNKNSRLTDQAGYQDYYQTDEYGFRYNPAHATTPDTALKHVLMVGDSFTYGLGVDHLNNYPAYVERNLRSAGADILVDNSGVPGYGPDQEYIYLRDELLLRKPEFVIWNWNANDISDSNWMCLFRQSEGTFKQLPAALNTIYLEGVAQKYLPQWLQKTLVYNFLLANSQLVVMRSDRITIGCSLPGWINRNTRNTLVAKKIHFFLTEINKRVQEYGGHLFLVIVPLQFYFETNKVNNQWMDDYYLLKQILNKENISIIDANQILAQLKNPSVLTHGETANVSDNRDQDNMLGVTSENIANALFLRESFPDGSHLNNEGNALLGEIVSEKLQSFINK